ncbi:PAS domain-containing protein [Sulfurospirillum barnesii]|uniref:PAS domain S-box n=1 Tax=Sulfurospirillum barnesii (strain ATCC 700032 / DSM 10660 / SES-3) TaxID=760154 RepID=I3XUU5_SULBS|nr:PAS domain-containing protein [Sulfurospirillum barnesii]AFL67719.1 PAS domain S-box [Sulfurospirillum barnesii SES-3]
MPITQKGDAFTFDENFFIVSKTDLKGHITYANELFIKISGYSEKELLGAPHNIVRHADMPKAIFKLVWDKAQAGDEIFAYIKNRTKSGHYYWVHAYITPIFDTKTHAIIGYHSVRRAPNPKGIAAIEPLYQKMLQAEQTGGIQHSLSYLNTMLSDLKVSYAQFIFSHE